MKLSWSFLLRHITLALCIGLLGACVENTGQDKAPVDATDDPIDDNIGDTAGQTACEGDPWPEDRDCDGLSDIQETTGWQVTVDYTGRGDSQTYTVTSNPDAADTDGDGLNDFREYTNHYDPRKADTDEDGLSDYDEKYVYATQPLNADSDGDNVGTDQFKDGDEVERGTSPLEADTDGDGMDDPLEALTLLSNPRVADKPDIEFTFIEAPVITVNCSETDGTSSSYGFSAEESSSQSHSLSHENAFSIGLEHSIAATIGTEMEARAGLVDYGGMTLSMSLTQSLTQSFSTSFALGGEHTNENSDSFSQFEEASREESRTCEDADITVWAELTNAGDMSFKMDNMSVVVYEFNRVDPEQRGTPIITLLPVQSDLAVTLAPQATARIELTTGDNKLTLDVARQLMSRRTYMEAFEAGTANVWISPAGTEQNYAYQADDVKAKTATVVVDAGGRADTYQVAVKQRFDAETNQVLGLTVAEVAEAMGMQYATEAVDIDIDGSTVPVKRIASLNGVANDSATNMRWLVAGDFTTLADSGYDIEQVRLKPGDMMYFLYTRDADGDGIGVQEESLYGTSDDNLDSDGDGLLDYEEIRSGWTVAGLVSYQTFSDPARADDYDGDGLTDPEEKARGTNPYVKDTEGDAIPDDSDPDPLVYTVGPSISDFTADWVEGTNDHYLTWKNGTGEETPDGIVIFKNYDIVWNGEPVDGTDYSSQTAVYDDDGVGAMSKAVLTNGETHWTSTYSSADVSNVYYYAYPYVDGADGKPIFLKGFMASVKMDLTGVTMTDGGEDYIRFDWTKPKYNFGGVLVLKASAVGSAAPPEVAPTDGVDYSAATDIDGVEIVYAGDGSSFTDYDVDAGTLGTPRDYYYVIYGYDADFNYFGGRLALRRDQLYRIEPGMGGPEPTSVTLQAGDQVDIWSSGSWTLDAFYVAGYWNENLSPSSPTHNADGSAELFYYWNASSWTAGTWPNASVYGCDGGGAGLAHSPVVRVNTGASRTDYWPVHPDGPDFSSGYGDHWSTSSYSGAEGAVELYACFPTTNSVWRYETFDENSNSRYLVRVRLQRWTDL